MEPYICRNVDMSNAHMGENWLYVGLDLGERIWVAGLLDLRTCDYASRKFESEGVRSDCLEWLFTLKDSGCRVHVLYEAGRQGFELARQLRSDGISTTIVAVSRLEKSRKKKRGKSDRMDAKALTYMDWTDKRFPSVWVPSREQEGMRNLLMWELTLDGSLRRCRNRGVSVLARWGISYKLGMSAKVYKALLEGLSETAVGDMDRLRLESLQREEDFLNAELNKLGSVRDVCLESDPAVEKLQVWRGIGDKSAQALAWYVGDWRRFPNGNSFSAYCGLTSVHSRSATSDRDKGVSRAGHWVLRKTLGQLALLWQRWQPDCTLVKSSSEKVTKGKAGRIARTALARQLAVALWKWMVYDELIEGAIQKTSDK